VNAERLAELRRRYEYGAFDGIADSCIIVELLADREQFGQVLGDLYSYVLELEGRYGGQVAARSYLSFPEGAEELGDRVRAALSSLSESSITQIEQN
jgi:hypothetical protein